MEILTANAGSYPRVGEEENQLRLREAYQNWEVNDVSDEELESVYEDYTEEIINEQEAAGLDIVTDGQLRWYDPLSHFAREIDGCEINGLLRYFDTNFYFRQPVVESKIGWEGPIIKKEFLKASKVASETLKPVVTGPYTLAKYSIDNYYYNVDEFVMKFAEIIGKEINELSKAGAEEIQINEPKILDDNEDEYEIFSRAMEKISDSNNNSRLNLQVYFGDSTSFYEKFLDLPIDILSLDFTYSPELPEKIAEIGSEKPLGLGLVNARNTKMEKAEDLVPIIEKIVPAVRAEKVYLNPSCGIEFLPRERAYEKLENMVEIAERAEEAIM